MSVYTKDRRAPERLHNLRKGKTRYKVNSKSSLVLVTQTSVGPYGLISDLGRKTGVRHTKFKFKSSVSSAFIHLSKLQLGVPMCWSIWKSK
jgi:hypothetical protein